MSRSSIAAATASTIAAFASMPVLAAWAPMSLITASICAVTAVMALVPYTPCAANVLRSAWMPAPPPESLPAMVRAVRIGAAEQSPQAGHDRSGDEQFQQIDHHERIDAKRERDGEAHRLC